MERCRPDAGHPRHFCIKTHFQSSSMNLSLGKLFQSIKWTITLSIWELLNFPKMCFSNFGYSNVLNSLSPSNSHSLGLMKIKRTWEEASGGNSHPGLVRMLIRGPNWHPSTHAQLHFCRYIAGEGPGLLERYQDPISMYVLLCGCCCLPRLLSLDFPSHSTLHCTLGDLPGTQTQAGQNPASSTLGSHCL